MRALLHPNLLTEDVPSLAVKAFLVTYDYTGRPRRRGSRDSRALCENFGTLQAEGHPKWKEVELAMPELGRGWAYYPPIAREFERCMGARARPAQAKSCTTEQKILGFCE